jgi:succinoglycan biosynthesis transport protein ExoP
MIQDPGNANDALMVADSDEEADGRRRRAKVLALLRGRYHWAIAAALVLGVSAGVAGYFSQDDVYTSSGRLEMRPSLPNFGGGHSGPPQMWEQYMNTKVSQVRSGAVIQRAMASETWKRAAEAAGIAQTFTGKDFLDALSVHRARQSNLISLSFTHDVPAVALAGIDATINAYRQVYQEGEDRRDAELLEVYLTQQSKLEFDIRRFTEQRNNLMGGPYGSEVIGPQHQWALDDQLRLQAELTSIDRQLTSLGDGESLMQASTNELLAIDRTLSNIEGHRQAIKQEMLRNEMLGITRSHRTMRNLQAQLDIADQEFNNRVASLRSGRSIPDGVLGGGSDVDSLHARKRDLEGALAQAESRATQLGTKLRQVREIESGIDKATNDLARVRANIERMDLSKMISGRLEVAGTGDLPTVPSNRGARVKYAGGAGLLGAAAGVGLIMLIGLMDPRLRHFEDAEIDLPHARMLGILPTLPADLNDPEQAVLVAHSVHHIRTLLQIGREPTGNVFSVSSPAAGSGKTSLTMAMGLSFAASGCKTLLIDADIVGGGLTRRMGFVVHPRLGQVLRQMGTVTEPQIADALRVAQSTGSRIGEAMISLGYVTDADIDEALQRQEEQSIGLLEACGDQRFEECVAPTGIRSLYVLPIGTALPQQAGALSPSAIRRIISQARTQFDTVLIDTGPMLGSLEASMAAAEADATVLIVSRGDQKPLINKCVQHLQSLNGRLAGVVFNHALATDIARSTYGSVTMSQSRHPANQARVEVIDADTSARFGPLATAVASYAAGASVPARREETAGVASGNGNTKSRNGNGKHN